MTYTQEYHLLKNLFDQSVDSVDIPGYPVSIVNCTLVSDSRHVLPGADHYVCETHGVEFTEKKSTEQQPHELLHLEGLSLHDAHFQGNSECRYTIFKPSGVQKSDSTIFLLHGLNERYWHKYLPWALRLVELTGSSVCLIPIAFHMNRAPLAWGSPKAMNEVAKARQKSYPSIAESSFANAAISTRLHSIPQRFFWSGVQTYYDVLQIVQQIRSGQHERISSNAHINFFAYSIGSFLAQILMMANKDAVFGDSRLFIFCGGPTFDRMYPVSKYIIDSEALIALYSFFVEHLENEFKRDTRLAHFFNEGHQSGIYFKAMLSNRKLKDLREARLRELSTQIMAVALKKDDVIQPSEVLNTLNGDFRDIPIPVHIMDFPFEYSHVAPFPIQNSIAEEVNRSFDQVFNLAASHLS